VFRAGSETLLMANLIVPGDLEISLYSANGQTREAVLNKETRSGLVIHRWNGFDPRNSRKLRGKYRIRWTTGGNSYREQSVTITD
jgi:hypothetical protein